MQTLNNDRVYNFSPGPGVVFEAVLEKAAKEMMNYKGSGMSVMEMSHRSKVYETIINDTKDLLVEIMSIPSGYQVLFLQGGATTQFSMIPMNLLGENGVADYAVSGYFSKKAAEECAKYGKTNVSCNLEHEQYARIPIQDELTLSNDARYFHYCMNNTIYGTRWNYLPKTNAPLVCDMSSCILSESVDVSKYGLIYAGAQKNMGPAGLCVVIIKENLSLDRQHCTPTMFDYAIQIKNASMYNTPPTYSIYILGLVLKHLKQSGGIDSIHTTNLKKSKLIYDVIDRDDFYKSKVEKSSRSIMNITFTTGNEDLDKLFVSEAASNGLLNLAGHRIVGGMRASIYNAMPYEGCEKLSNFMLHFSKKNQSLRGCL